MGYSERQIGQYVLVQEQTSKRQKTCNCKTKAEIIAELTVADLPPRLAIEMIDDYFRRHPAKASQVAVAVKELNKPKKDVRKLDDSPEALARARELIQVTI